MVASKLILSPSGADVPLPELTDSNYLVTTIYMCLLPESFVRTNIEQLETARSNAQEDEEAKEVEEVKAPKEYDPSHEVVVTDDEIKGWLLKTVQDVGMF